MILIVLARSLPCLCKRNILYSACIFVIGSKNMNVHGGPLLRAHVRTGVVVDLLLDA